MAVNSLLINLDPLFTPYTPPDTHLVDRLRYWCENKSANVAFYYSNNDDDEISITYAELDRQARAIAAQLTSLGMHGERALLLYPPGLEFVSAFFGCLYAGAVAVPAFPPRRNRKMTRIQAISDDAEAAIVLTDHATVSRVQPVIAETPHLKRMDWLATDKLFAGAADDWRMPTIRDDTLAVVQYTSGSTGTPKGVMLSHGNLIENCRLITYGFSPGRSGIGLTWLPTYHDMGLVGGVLNPLFYGRPNALMSPMAFLQKPVRWLRGISRYKVTISGGPNFAYALCNDKITPEECEGLDLSTWEVAFNGAEPIRADTLKTFTEKFAPYGFHAETHYPCYGMAETTLIVTGGLRQEPPVVQAFDNEALESRRVIPASNGDATAKKLVGCGRVLPNQEILIVDEDSRLPVENGRIGEIWVAGRTVGQGYWNKTDETQEFFRAHLASGDGKYYLRTGDLGFFHEDELFVTGRCKDLIIIRGRNLYPQDIEATVESCHDAVLTGGGAVFSIETDGEEQLVAVQELERQFRNGDTDAVIDVIRQAVLRDHDVPLHTVALLRTGKLPKTSSGKVQRSVCRTEFLNDELEPLALWSLADAGDPAAKQTAPIKKHAKNKSAAAIQTWLQEQIADKLKSHAADIDIHAPFEQFGLDSLALVSISGDLEDWLGESVNPTLLYGYPTIAALADHLAETTDADAAATTSTPAQTEHEPIAVIGVGCRFPGATNPEEFWQLLRDGVDAIREVSPDRWDVDATYDPNLETPGKMYTKQGGFLDNVDQFDPQFFSIAPREAIGIDPQQRLLLEIAWETLENAGQSPDKLSGSATGVFVGISNNDYSRLQSRLGGLDSITAHTGTGSLNSIAAGRLSYVLGLRGPTMAVDTACSSSLVAVHLATQSLRNGACRAALAGGVNLILDPSSSIALSKLSALSPAGRCKTFDESADGYVRGEGCGMVLLKRLSDAVEDGDRVLAIVRGSAVNHDGRSNGLTAPHGPSQEALIRAALADAAVEPNLISYVEAHGTGTSLGDPIEVQAMAAEYAGGRTEDQPLAIGSVKTNIGHLESAAGIASLIKVILSLGHGEIPPHLHLEKPNPYIPWDDLPITVSTERIAWDHHLGRRLAGISSFGFSGTNAHVIVEGVNEAKPAKSDHERSQHLLALSAKNQTALKQLAGQYEKCLRDNPAELANVCFTAAAGRSHFSHRLAIVGGDADRFCDRLAAARDDRFATNLIQGEFDAQQPPNVALLFTGQGSQYVGMGRTLFDTQPTFRAALEKCDELLRDELERPLLEVLYPSDGSTALNQTAYTQPALFALEYALYELWKSWGIQPDIVAGHSVGEYVAACVAGVFSLEDGLKLIAARGRLMQALPESGSMVAVMTNAEDVLDAIETRIGDVSIAAINAPEQTVISGPTEAVQPVVELLESNGVRTMPLTVSHAFHSSLMEPMLDEFEEICRGVTFSPPQIPLVTNVDGSLATDEVTKPRYWRSQIRSAVQFVDTIVELDRQGANVFLEIGPKPILTTAGKQCLPDSEHVWTSSLRSGQDDWSPLLQSLGELYVAGVEIDWEGFDRDYQRRKVALPTYPFQRHSYWLELDGHDSRPAARRTGASQVASDQMSDAFFEIQWQPRSRFDQPLAHRGADFIPAPADLGKLVQPEQDRLKSQISLERYQTLDVELDKLAGAYVRAAMTQLGWTMSLGENVNEDELAQRLKIADEHRWLFARLLEMLAEDGLLVGEEGAYQVADKLPAEPDPELILSLLTPRFPECDAELAVMSQCGRNLADVLNGTADALQVLFPSGSAAMVEKLYRDSPFARTLNTLVEETVAQSINDLPADRCLKMLEIGAGTGGTTTQILPRLPADRTEYVFTDVSEIFTRAAEQKFGDYPFLRYDVLDIEQDPQGQGFASHQFDVILAANVLHATQDLKTTLQHVRQLLAPGGVLILLEGSRPQRLLDLSFGMTDGWWRFTDKELRPKYALLAAQQWADLLCECGFAAAEGLPGPAGEGDDAILSPHAVIVGKADDAASESTRDQAAKFTEAGSWLLLADEGGVADKLATALKGQGESCVVVAHGDSYKQTDDDSFTVRPDQADDFAKLLAAAWQNGRPACRGVVHLWSLDTAAPDDLSVSALQRAQQLCGESVLHTIQQLSKKAWVPPPSVWLVSRGAQLVAGDGEVSGLAQAPVWGIGRVMSEELPSMWGGLIDLESSASADEAAGLLLDEISGRDDEDQIAYRGDQRYAARLIGRPENQVLPKPIPWRSDASYLISGGLGDLGLKIAQWMVDQGAQRLILFSRSHFPPRAHWDSVAEENPRRAAQIEAIRKLEAAGARVQIAAIDVADEPALSAFLDDLEPDGWPPIRGVVHAAGIAEAQTLLELEQEELARVLRPKVAGAWLLHHLLRDARLDFFVSFSSGAALLGSPLLASYAAANAFLDAISHHRRAQGQPALSINWGFWDEVGMVARSQREIGRGFAPQGMQSFSPEQGLAAMQQLLEERAVQTAVMPVDWEEWCTFHPRAAQAALLSNLLKQRQQLEDQTAADGELLSRDALLAAPADEQLPMLEEFLCTQLSRVMRMPVEELDVSQPLNNLGIDSLMAVELRNHVQANLGVVIPVAQLLQDPSIAQLATILHDQLTGDTSSSDSIGGANEPEKAEIVAEPAASAESTAANQLANLDGLSDDEIDDLLNKMTN